MYSEIDDYRNNSDDNYEKYEFPCQGIEVCTTPFEHSENNKISHRNHYSNNNDRSSKKIHSHSNSVIYIKAFIKSIPSFVIRNL